MRCRHRILEYKIISRIITRLSSDDGSQIRASPSLIIKNKATPEKLFLDIGRNCGARCEDQAQHYPPSTEPRVPASAILYHIRTRMS